METAATMKSYRGELESALEDKFLRKTLDKFAVEYRPARDASFTEIDEQALFENLAASKDASLARMHELYEQFKKEAEKRGAHVYLAKTIQDANELIYKIAQDNNCHKIVKSKSMTSEEIRLND
jgi:L-lactate utilization protein LutB